MEEWFAQFCRRNYCVRADHSCHVERFAWSSERYAALGGFWANGCKGDMGVAPQGHVGMNFVGDDNDTVFVAELGQSDKGRTVPDNATWIVGIAQDQQAAFVVCDLLKIVEIHGV